MARAKNTTRADARRRTREAQRAELNRQEAENRKTHEPTDARPGTGASRSSSRCPTSARTSACCRRCPRAAAAVAAAGHIPGRPGLVLVIGALPRTWRDRGSLPAVLLRAAGAVHLLHRRLCRAPRLVPGRLHLRRDRRRGVVHRPGSPSQCQTWPRSPARSPPSCTAWYTARWPPPSPPGTATSCAACRLVARSAWTRKPRSANGANRAPGGAQNRQARHLARIDLARRRFAGASHSGVAHVAHTASWMR